MKILHIEKAPVLRFKTINATRKGGSVTEFFPVHRGVMSRLPAGIKMLICASDLQCFDPPKRRSEARLFGFKFAEEMEKYARQQRLNPIEDVAVILAGDLFAVRNKLGGLGDTSAIWRAFADRFAWVAGVMGNHDILGAEGTMFSWMETLGRENLSILHTGNIERGGLRFAGLSGCLQDWDKPWRFSEDRYLHLLEETFLEPMDCLILHDGPDFPKEKLRGQPAIRDFLAKRDGPPLVIRGHKHWPDTFYKELDGKQILNCEGNAFVFRT